MPKQSPGHYALKTLVQFGVLGILTLNVLLVFGTLVVFGDFSEHAHWSAHTAEVQNRLLSLGRDMFRAEALQRGFLLTGREEYLIEFTKLVQVEADLNLLQEAVQDNPPQVERVTLLRRVIEEKIQRLNRQVVLKKSDRVEELQSEISSDESLRTSSAIDSAIAEMVRVESTLLAGRRRNVEVSQNRLNWLLIGGLGLTMLVGFRVLTFLSHRLAPLADCAAFADSIGSGDLPAAPLQVQFRDEVGSVVQSLNSMLANLRRLTHNTLSSADTLNSATARIAEATREQAVALQQQSAAMQQTSVTVEELGQSAAQIADRAREVASRAEATSRSAAAGSEAVRKTSQSTQALVEQVRVVAERISALSEKTQAIRDIVLTVNEISERSNVLALNASILAAASGAEGKSFTIIAHEIKNLSEQSKDATVTVRALLGEVERGIHAAVQLSEEATKRSSAGSAYTEEADQTIRHLSEHVNDSLQAFQQIVAATNQQHLAFEQVTDALHSIRQACQQSANSTQQLEQAASDLHRLSGNLLSSLDNRSKDGSV